MDHTGTGSLEGGKEMKTCILALAAWLMALPLFLKIVEIIVAPSYYPGTVT